MITTKEIPAEMFQSLTEIESHLKLAAHIMQHFNRKIEPLIQDHTEKNALFVHLHYLDESVKQIAITLNRYNNMRYFFTPKIGV